MQSFQILEEFIFLLLTWSKNFLSTNFTSNPHISNENLHFLMATGGGGGISFNITREIFSVQMWFEKRSGVENRIIGTVSRKKYRQIVNKNKLNVVNKIIRLYTIYWKSSLIITGLSKKKNLVCTDHRWATIVDEDL